MKSQTHFRGIKQNRGLLSFFGYNNSTLFDYDAHGNMISMPGTENMIWNAKDELAEAKNSTETFHSYYRYDAHGNRTRKVTVKGNVREEYYYVDGYELFRKHTNEELSEEYKTVNISDDEKVFARIESRNNTSVIRYQYDNHLGSACLELNDRGDLISYEEYYAFGETAYFVQDSTISVSLKRYRYCGKEKDEETGLYYYGMRYYAAWLGRFVSVDPLQFEYPELTPFQYASNRPVTMIDLDGLEGVEPDEVDKEPSGVYNENNELIGSAESPIMLNTVTVSSNTTSSTAQNGAWEIINQWDESKINEFENFVSDQTNQYIEEGFRFTCEDFALSLLIDFASTNGLPVTIHNANGIYSARYSNYADVSTFKNDVLTTTGARDLQNDNNTVQVEMSRSRSGDIIVNRNENNIGTHIQTITAISYVDNTDVVNYVSIAQGNSGFLNKVPGSSFLLGAGNPNSSFYTGKTIERGSLNVNANIYFNNTKGTTTYNFRETKNIDVRRWNFSIF